MTLKDLRIIIIDEFRNFIFNFTRGIPCEKNKKISSTFLIKENIIYFLSRQQI